MVVHVMKLRMTSFVPAHLDTLETPVKPTSMNVRMTHVRMVLPVLIWWVISFACVLQDSPGNSAMRL